MEDWDKYTQQIKQLCDFVAGELLLQGHRFTYRFYESQHEDGPVVAETTVNIPYFTVLISFYLPMYEAWKEKQVEELKGYITHEMCHVLTAPLAKALDGEIAPAAQSFADTLNEQVTERICRAMMQISDWQNFNEILEVNP